MENFAQSYTTPLTTSATPMGVADTGVASTVMLGTPPVYASGGPIQQPAPPKRTIGAFFEGITLLDVGMIALSSLALFMSIYYTRQQIYFLKANKNIFRNDIDELKANVKSIMGEEYKQL